MIRAALMSVALCGPLAVGQPLAEDSGLMRAMRDELGRTMAELRLRDLERPYFVSYTVREVTASRAEASLGSAVSRGQSASRLLWVELRVGEPAMDNTNFVSRQGFGGASAYGRMPVSLPLDNDYRALRRRIWLATDGVYKQALEHLARKRAALQNETRPDEVPDFSPAEPFRHEDSPREPMPQGSQLEAVVRRVSAAFRGRAHVYVSAVAAEERSEVVSYVNSEGSAFRKLKPQASVRVLAGTQAADGTPIEDTFSVFARTADRLGSADMLAERARGLSERLARLSDAPEIERYSGPVLFEGQAAAQLVRRVFVPRLVASKVPVTDDSRIARSLSNAANPFVDKLGSRVLPRFMEAVDDSAADVHGGVPLLGGQAVDDEGVPTRRTELVRRGILRTLLSTRNPVRGVLASSGSRRAGGPAPTNLFLAPQPGLEAAELRAELIALVEERELEFGIIARRIAGSTGRIARGRGARGPSGPGGRVQISGLVAYRVFPDGREELVRPMEATGVSEADFRDIVAASAELTVDSGMFFNTRSASPAMAGFQRPVLTSVVVPSLLFEDVTLRRPTGNIPRPPEVPHPLGSD